VENKLLQCGYLPSTVEMVIYKLQTMNILNDQEFANQWVETRSNKLMGKRRIQQELMRKGISAQDAVTALDFVDDQSQEVQALQLAQKLAPRYSKDDPRKGLQKLMQALVRRGFDWSIAKEAASEALCFSSDDI
ncbi:MAG: regulatory protein RecX, partial [Clostridia bacterium]|nr:regulatory protein RecX [Clostridia bacterium]